MKSMVKKRLDFKDAFRSQIWLFVLCMVSVTVIGYFMAPINTLAKIGAFTCIVLFVAVSIISVVRKASNLVLCPSCSSNLYEVISQMGHTTQLKINYCPVCGEKLNS